MGSPRKVHPPPHDTFVSTNHHAFHPSTKQRVEHRLQTRIISSSTRPASGDTPVQLETQPAYPPRTSFTRPTMTSRTTAVPVLVLTMLISGNANSLLVRGPVRMFQGVLADRCHSVLAGRKQTKYQASLFPSRVCRGPVVLISRIRQCRIKLASNIAVQVILDGRISSSPYVKTTTGSVWLRR